MLDCDDCVALRLRMLWQAFFKVDADKAVFAYSWLGCKGSEENSKHYIRILSRRLMQCDNDNELRELSYCAEKHKVRASMNYASNSWTQSGHNGADCVEYVRHSQCSVVSVSCRKSPVHTSDSYRKLSFVSASKCPSQGEDHRFESGTGYQHFRRSEHTFSGLFSYRRGPKLPPHDLSMMRRAFDSNLGSCASLD